MPRIQTQQLNRARSPLRRSTQIRTLEPLRVQSPVSTLPRIRPCYAIISLGFVFITGSLVSAVWRTKAANDFSGGISVAQYILGVGAIVLGSMIGLHAIRCTCWQRRHVLILYRMKGVQEVLFRGTTSSMGILPLACWYRLMEIHCISRGSGNSSGITLDRRRNISYTRQESASAC